MKTAILLSSMGGPDSLQSVRPFLFNLFNDPAIIRLPSFLRRLLAHFISSRRTKTAQSIYSKMGGASPILANTRLQAEALQRALKDDESYRCFLGMSYWHPFIAETMKDIKKYDPDLIIVLPLYPQFSTTTTMSVKRDVRCAAQEQGISCEIVTIETFYQGEGFIEALAENAMTKLNDARAVGSPLVLFSAHGLPERIVRSGDPYARQCEETARLVANKMGLNQDEWVLCYQSRVGRLKWIGPSTDGMIEKAGQTQRAVVVVPIAFVCEHSETLVELDMEYRELAERSKVPFYAVAQTVGTKDAFIQGLATRIQGINQFRP